MTKLERKPVAEEDALGLHLCRLEACADDERHAAEEHCAAGHHCLAQRPTHGTARDSFHSATGRPGTCCFCLASLA